MTKKTKILFLCTGNSCRSQMAEGFAKKFYSDVFDIYSAGISTHGLNPDAVQVMSEVGIDISQQTSDQVDQYFAHNLDVVITVCGHADATCPVFPGTVKTLHVPFDDPPKLAQGANSESTRLAPYRRVRDEIADFVRSLPKFLADQGVVEKLWQ